MRPSCLGPRWNAQYYQICPAHILEITGSIFMTQNPYESRWTLDMHWIVFFLLEIPLVSKGPMGPNASLDRIWPNFMITKPHELNCWNDSKKTLIQKDTCPFCHIDGESVEHFLLVCTHFDKLRIGFENSIRNVLYSYDNLSLNSKLKYILDLYCPLEAVSSCCKFVSNINISQEKECNRANPDILLSPILDL